MGPGEVIVLIQTAKEIISSIRDWRRKKDQSGSDGAQCAVNPSALAPEMEDLRARIAKADEMLEAQARLIEKLAESVQSLSESNIRFQRQVKAMTWLAVGAAGLGTAALLVASLT